jgi:hypothetical protein
VGERLGELTDRLGGCPFLAINHRHRHRRLQRLHAVPQERLVEGVLRRVPDGGERSVAEEACGCGEQEELGERPLGDARDLARKIDNAFVAHGNGEDANIACAPDCFERSGFARLPVNPNLVGEVALPLSAPECGRIPAVRHFAAVPLMDEIHSFPDGVRECEQAIRPARVLDTVDRDGERISSACWIEMAFSSLMWMGSRGVSSGPIGCSVGIDASYQRIR